MPVEPRDAGRWRRAGDDPGPGNWTGGSDGGNLVSTSRRSPRPMVVGGTEGLDGAHAETARTKRADNRMVPALGQSSCARQSASRLLGGVAERRRPRSRWPNGEAVREGSRSRVGQAEGRTAEPTLPPATGAAGVDTQTRRDGETAAGHTGGPGSDGGSGLEARA